jgi:hypothetical protein
MHAVLILSAVLASQPSVPEQPDRKPPPAQKENEVGFHPMVLLGLGSGGETMAEFVYTDGSTKAIKAGGLLQVGAGLIIDFSGIPLQLQSTVGYHFDTLEASNGSGYIANSVRMGGLSAPTTSERINGNHIAGNFLLGF